MKSSKLVDSGASSATVESEVSEMLLFAFVPADVKNNLDKVMKDCRIPCYTIGNIIREC